MRKIYLVLIALGTIAIAASGQIKLTYKSQALAIGTSHDFVFNKEANEGAAGANVLWDFSGLQPVERTLTSHMLSTDSFLQSKEIPQANTIIEEFGNHFYFNVQNDVMEQYGTVSGNVITRYDQPFLKLKFPFTFGDKYTGNYSGVQESANSKVSVKGTYEVYGDAYGTLILPNSITVENVLRVKQTRTIDNGNGNSLQEITFRWYSKDVRYPVLVIIKYVTATSSNVAEVAMYAHAGEHNKSATTIGSVEAFSNLEVFPNPVENQLTVSFSLGSASKVSLRIIDETGRSVETLMNSKKLDSGKYNYTFSANNKTIKPGLYYLQVVSGKDLFTKKIVKR
jgi:hypothetical protein